MRLARTPHLSPTAPQTDPTPTARPAIARALRGRAPRIGIAALCALGVSSAGLLPANAEAAGTKSALHKRFNGVVGALADGRYKTFCKSYTRADLKRLGGVSSCVKGLRAQGSALRTAAASTKVRSVSVNGSRGTVNWSAAGRNRHSTWAYERGAWRLSVLLA